MSFEVVQSGDVITLKNNEGCSAEIYCVGAMLNKFSIETRNGNVNVIDGFASPAQAKEDVVNGFKCAKLSPFVCRMNKGKYNFASHDYKVNKFYLGEEAIHGLLFDVVFNVKSTQSFADAAMVTLNYSYNGNDKGYPFLYEIEITYTLKSNNTLTLTTSVFNKGNEAMPLSDGWHPYFTFGGTINNLFVQFNTDTMVEFDEHLLPTGNYIRDERFSSLSKFNDIFLDNCFVLKDHDLASCTLIDKEAGISLSIYADASYPYLQVYTPPHRQSIAVENLSSLPDAFNNKIGLIELQPNEAKTFETTYVLQHN